MCIYRTFCLQKRGMTFVFAHSFHFTPEGDTTTVHWLFIRLKGLQYTYLSILNTKEAFTMSGKIILETPRLLLREYIPEDFNALYEILSDPETMRHYPAPFDARRVKGWIDWNLQNYAEYGFGLWAVVRKESGAFIGDCGITLQNIDGEMLPEIGYHIHKNCWRQGYGTEAARAVRDWAFENLPYDRLYSYMKSTNVGSYSTALANGMTKVKEYPDEKNGSSYAYAITREQWKRLTK